MVGYTYFIVLFLKLFHFFIHSAISTYNGITTEDHVVCEERRSNIGFGLWPPPLVRVKN